MKILVVLVGHNRDKLFHLENLYYQNKPSIYHKLCLVYNGEGDYPGAIKCKNCLKGRDVYMYNKAVEINFKYDYYFFMNDDIVVIEGKDWLRMALQSKTEIIGAQTNLSSIISTDVIKQINKHMPIKWINWGNKAQFIRSSAFGCTKEYFLRVWEKSEGNAQAFEKNTIKLAKSWSVFENPFYIYDSNLAPYKSYFQLKKEIKFDGDSDYIDIPDEDWGFDGDDFTIDFRRKK